MGLVIMSERELNRIEVLSQVSQGRMTAVTAANVLDGDDLLLNVQANLLDALNTRMVVPLIAVSKAPVPAKRLNPVFMIESTEYVMVTQFMTAVPKPVLRDPAASLKENSEDITVAIDMLTQGF